MFVKKSGVSPAQYIGSDRFYHIRLNSIARALLLHISTPPNYKIDLEIQFTDIDVDKEYNEICIYAGPRTAENLEVYIWTGASWELLLSPLALNQWNNATHTITSDTVTLRFLGSIETGDTIQDTWNIDCSVVYAPP